MVCYKAVSVNKKIA